MPDTEIDLGTKTDDYIDTRIANYERKGATNEPFYKKLLEERAKRQSRGLKVELSLRHLHEMAHVGKFTTYGDLAAANSVPWSQARHAMNGSRGHLEILLEVCHARGIPLLTAICVNQAGLSTGELGDDALTGFISGAKRLGHTVTDEREFLRDRQRECFEWAKSHPPQVGADQVDR